MAAGLAACCAEARMGCVARAGRRVVRRTNLGAKGLRQPRCSVLAGIGRPPDGGAGREEESGREGAFPWRAGGGGG